MVGYNFYEEAGIRPLHSARLIAIALKALLIEELER